MSQTPQRTDSVKKPKIKINNTPKANGTDTPKASAKKESKPKASKPKKANGTTNGDGSATPKEPALTEQQKREKKEASLSHETRKPLLTYTCTEGDSFPTTQAPKGSPYKGPST